MNKKVVLAYSGGLDTSIILRWLQDELGYEVVTFSADIGQQDELESAYKKAEMMGVKSIYIENLQEQFARDFVFPMFRANTVYEGEYLLGTSIARPLIAQRLVEIAHKENADAIAHGATGKGNDQVRFELSAYALNPDIKIIAPWRIWHLNSRKKLMEYAANHNIPIDFSDGKKSPYSMDANLLHISYESDQLEDPAVAADESMWRMTTSPKKAPQKAEKIRLGFYKGDLISINGTQLAPHQLMHKLNEIAAKHGIGRIDIVENRFVGMKARGCYETPAGSVMLVAHRALESITLDRQCAHLKDEIMPKYAELIYNGFWFSPERQMLQKMIDFSQQYVTGQVSMELYKGKASVLSRKSPYSLFDQKIASFEDDKGSFSQADATGFISLNALRLKTYARRNKNTPI